MANFSDDLFSVFEENDEESEGPAILKIEDTAADDDSVTVKPE